MTKLFLLKAFTVVAMLSMFSNVAFTQNPTCHGGNETCNNQSGCGGGSKFCASNEACPGFCTETQGAYGASPCGKNPASYLKSNFSIAFPNGVTIGAGASFLKLTSFNAVQAFLPCSGTPSVLPKGTLTNPSTKSCNNTLAGQLVTLTINVGLDNAIPSFGSSTTNLKDLIVTQSPFFGWSVQNVLDEANKKIAGVSTSTFSLSDFNNCLTYINESYDNGVLNTNDILICPFAVKTAQTNVSCYGGNNGSTTISSITGGVAPYTYSWSNGAKTSGLSNIKAGTYTLTITDAIGLKYVIVYTVSQPAQLIGNTSSTPISCNGGVSTVTVGASGGIAPYTGTGSYTVGAGTYNYILTDANGCSANTSVTVTQPSQLTVTTTATPILCNGGSSSLTVQANGGTPPYYYMAMTASSLFTPPDSGTGIYSVHAGTYTYDIQDGNGCPATASVSITQPPVLTVATTATPILCNGGSSNLTVQANGGTAPYYYMAMTASSLFTPPDSGTGIYNVLAGTYTYDIQDANGCPATASVSITQPTELNATSTFTVAPSDSSSYVVTVAATGGTGSYSGTGTYIVTAGTYSYTVTDANGCSSTTTINVDPRLTKSKTHRKSDGQAMVVENLESDFSVFPNPAKDIFNIQFNSSASSSGLLSIYDMEGKLILKQNITIVSGRNTIDMNTNQLQTNQGMIFIQVSYNDQVITRKLVISKIQ